MVGRVDKKNDGCDGEVGLDAGNAPTFASLVNKYVIDAILSEGHQG